MNTNFSLTDLRSMWNAILAAYPQMSSVEWVSKADDASAMEFMPGQPPTLQFTEYAPLGIFEEFLESRKLSCQLVAELLGIQVAGLTPELLRAFIFLHECGHAHDFVVNFAGFSSAGHPENAARRFDEACMRCNERREVELTKLPVPITPSGFLASRRESEDFLASLVGRAMGKETATASELDAMQEKLERAYKALPSEAYADRFAKEFLQPMIAK